MHQDLEVQSKEPPSVATPAKDDGDTPSTARKRFHTFMHKVVLNIWCILPFALMLGGERKHFYWPGAFIGLGAAAIMAIALAAAGDIDGCLKWASNSPVTFDDRLQCYTECFTLVMVATPAVIMGGRAGFWNWPRIYAILSAQFERIMDGLFKMWGS